MINKLDENQMNELLKKQLIGRIGCHADDVTYVVPISYTFDGNSIYAHTHEGMKVEMMRKNPSVCFEVDDTHDNANWKSVIAWGTFEELTEPGQREKALQLLLNRTLPMNSSATTHIGVSWPFSANDLKDVKGIVFKIKIENKTGRFESNSQSSSPDF